MDRSSGAAAGPVGRRPDPIWVRRGNRDSTLRHRPRRADEAGVSTTGFGSVDEVDRLLSRLDGRYQLATAEDLRMVIGPGGVFVVGMPGDDGDTSRVAEASRRTRETIAQHLTYVPFVDAVVVDVTGTIPHDEVSVVPPDLLTTVFGGHSLSPEMVDLLVDHLYRDLLIPWIPKGRTLVAGPPAGNGPLVIDLDALERGTH